MSESIYVLTSPKKSVKFAALSLNKHQRRIHDNSKLPSYMQKKDNTPMVISFDNMNLARVFVNHRLYQKPILKTTANFENRLKIHYDIQTIHTPPLAINIEDLSTLNQDEVSQFVLQTQASFYLIDMIQIDKLKAEVQGTMLNPFDDVEIDISFQHEIYRVLEEIYELE